MTHCFDISDTFDKYKNSGIALIYSDNIKNSEIIVQQMIADAKNHAVKTIKLSPKERSLKIEKLIKIIVNDLNFENHPDYLKAIFLALISAFLAAFFSVINSVLVKDNDSAIISFYELMGGFWVISILFYLNGDIVLEQLSLNTLQFFWLMVLGVVCTSFAFLLGVYVMKFIKPYTVNLSVNLEPIYAIIFALLIFKNSELMNLNFYLGSMIVVGSILLNALFKKTKKPQKVA